MSQWPSAQQNFISRDGSAIRSTKKWLKDDYKIREWQSFSFQLPVGWLKDTRLHCFVFVKHLSKWNKTQILITN